MQEPSEGTPDGPWYVAETIHVIVKTGALRREDWTTFGALASRLSSAGLPVARLVLVGDVPFLGQDRGSSTPDGLRPEPASDVAEALRFAIASQADCLVVDGPLALDAGTFAELRRVAATDPMIAMVSPRFDSHSATGRSSAEMARMGVPAVTYVSLPDRRCLYVKGSILAQFASKTVSPEADWDEHALAINRYGFRVVLANHAVVRLEPGPDSQFGVDLAARAARLEWAYPGIRSAVASFLTGAPRVTERLLAGLDPDGRGRREVAFDFTHIERRHSGTAELARSLIQRATVDWSATWDVFVVAHAASYAYHFAELPVRPQRVAPEDPRTFAAYIRIGQPFSWKELDHAVRRAPVLVFFMLDTIGLDCIGLAPDELDALWRFVLAEADGVLFNSAFTQRQFERRFRLRHDLPKMPSLHSLRLADYGRASSPETRGNGVLVVGNGFAHKYVVEAVHLLAAAHPGQSIVALGLEPGAIAGVTSHASGSLGREALDGLYRNARVVVYPSVYEGFGFPVLEALAHNKPVLVRALAPFAEVLRGLPEAANVHVFHSDADLVRLVGSELRWTEQRGAAPVRDWDDCTADVLRVLEDALDRVSYHRVLRRVEFMRGRMEWIRRKRFRTVELAGGAAAGEDVERLAGLVGRIAQDVVLKLGRAPGSAFVLDLAKRALRRGTAS